MDTLRSVRGILPLGGIRCKIKTTRTTVAAYGACRVQTGTVPAAAVSVPTTTIRNLQARTVSGWTVHARAGTVRRVRIVDSGTRENALSRATRFATTDHAKSRGERARPGVSLEDGKSTCVPVERTLTRAVSSKTIRVCNPGIGRVFVAKGRQRSKGRQNFARLLFISHARSGHVDRFENGPPCTDVSRGVGGFQHSQSNYRKPNVSHVAGVVRTTTN